MRKERKKKKDTLVNALGQKRERKEKDMTA